MPHEKDGLSFLCAHVGLSRSGRALGGDPGCSKPGLAWRLHWRVWTDPPPSNKSPSSCNISLRLLVHMDHFVGSGRTQTQSAINWYMCTLQPHVRPRPWSDFKIDVLWRRVSWAETINQRGPESNRPGRRMSLEQDEQTDNRVINTLSVWQSCCRSAREVVIGSLRSAVMGFFFLVFGLTGVQFYAGLRERVTSLLCCQRVERAVTPRTRWTRKRLRLTLYFGVISAHNRCDKVLKVNMSAPWKLVTWTLRALSWRVTL